VLSLRILLWVWPELFGSRIDLGIGLETPAAFAILCIFSSDNVHCQDHRFSWFEGKFAQASAWRWYRRTSAIGNANARLVSMHSDAHSGKVRVTGDPPVAYIKQSTFESDFPSGVREALVNIDPRQALADLSPLRLCGAAERAFVIALRDKVPILKGFVSPQQWVAAVDADGEMGWSKRILTLGAPPKQWEATWYAPLVSWVDLLFDDTKLAKLNNFVGGVVLHSNVNLYVHTIQAGHQAVGYRVKDYSNLCCIYSLCMTVNQLPVGVRKQVTDRLLDCW
jgi:hypothetical protein